MNINKLDGALYLSMIRCGAEDLAANKSAVNDLNVFPIPDGDTGDNMYMTINAGCSASPSDSLSKTAAAASSAMLLGARGNSGVILSRIFAGMAKGFNDDENDDVRNFTQAMQAAVKEAYGAVSTPVEGTILTVMREAADVAAKSNSSTLEDLFDLVCKEMEASLERTPDLLPVLKESGVVDSGGAGLLCIFKGMRTALDGRVVEAGTVAQTAKIAVNLDAFGPDSELEFGYCTEFLLRLQSSKVDIANFDESEIKDYLVSEGESVVCFKEGSIVKVHVHTKTPGDILNHCQKWGEYLSLKIENMTLQHNETGAAKESFLKRSKPFASVAVACGAGLVSAFKEAGADAVIEGGQTMNPSAEDFLKAFDALDASVIFVFPNNSNIIMTAQQAASMYSKSKVVVMPSKTIGAGYVGIASLDYSLKEIKLISEAALHAMDAVATGLVSVAVRDTEKDGFTIKKGDFIGFQRNRIMCVESTPEEAALKLADALGLGGHDVALVFSGCDVEAGKAESLAAELQSKWPRTEIMTTDGGQPVYNYIIVLC